MLAVSSTGEASQFIRQKDSPLSLNDRYEQVSPSRLFGLLARHDARRGQRNLAGHELELLRKRSPERTGQDEPHRKRQIGRAGLWQRDQMHGLIAERGEDGA